MRTVLRTLSILMSIVLLLGLCACKKATGDMSSDIVEIQHTTEYIDADEIGGIESTASQTSSVQSVTSNESDVSSQQTSSNNESQETTSDNVSSVTSQNTSSEEVDPNKSQQPNVTICAAVAPGVCAVGGVCPVNTEYIIVGGKNITQTKIIPAKGNENSYFLGQIKISDTVSLEIQCKQSGKELSNTLNMYAFYNANQENLQTVDDYKVTFGSDSRMHFYSALLSYSLSNVVNNDMREFAEYNISQTVSYAKNANAEVIYLVVPSSAAVYPETVPSEYKAATGESIYQAFNKIATKCGAKVIYPLDTMKAHKNDGEGYKIYSHTDSHWTTYGAYWGVYELMNYIGEKYPSAKPRSVSDMGFYTAELYGGDALFSFYDNKGFENYSEAAKNGGKTKQTEIKELTTLYNRKMPTDTLSKITRNKKSVYLTKDNEAAKKETNPSATGLPSALIVRDSFGRTAYDMVNDRFSEVNWLAEGDYTSVLGEIVNSSPNYVIYIVSERNLIKVMLNDKNIPLKSFA